MADTNPPPANLGSDVQIIREILFGEQFEMLRQRIESLEGLVDALQKENAQLLKSLKAETSDRQRGDRKSNEQIESLDGKIQEQLEQVNERFNSLLASESQSRHQALVELDRRISARLEQVKADFSQIFEEHQKLEQGLVGRLAQALTGYQNLEVTTKTTSQAK